VSVIGERPGQARAENCDGRQDKNGAPSVGVYVIGLIGDFAPTLKHLVLSLAAENSMISKLQAAAAMPTATDSPPLLELLQYDNHMP
jgi:hypothetical protein